MTPSETVIITRYVKACCPQQAIDEFTPDAWHELLGAFGYQECRDAVTAVARRQPFVAPAEIIAEISWHRPPPGSINIEAFLDGSWRTQFETADAEFLRKLAARTGRTLTLKSIPPEETTPCEPPPAAKNSPTGEPQ
jgi:hypothetical protein